MKFISRVYSRLTALANIYKAQPLTCAAKCAETQNIKCLTSKCFIHEAFKALIKALWHLKKPKCWQVVKSCQLNVLSSVFIAPHSRWHHCYSLVLRIPLSDCQIMSTMQGIGNVNASSLEVEMFHLSSGEWFSLFKKTSYILLFVCHLLIKVPFVLQICLLHELPLSCENAQISCSNSNSNTHVASGKQPPALLGGIMWVG